jgi:S1-C subfamily serine protease
MRRDRMLRWTAVTVGVLSALAARAASNDVARAAGRVGIHRGTLAQDGAYLGVSLGDVGSEDVARLRLAEERGALVKEVEADTPAAKAGLKEGDVILGYQGERVQSAAQLARLVRETPPGRKVTLDVSRQGSMEKMTATVGEDRGASWLPERTLKGVVPRVEGELLPEPQESGEAPLLPEDMDELLKGTGRLREEMDRLHLELGGGGRRRLGIRYQEIEGQLAGYFKVEKGLLVTDVDAESPAGRAGLRAGDVILKVNGRPVTTSSDLRAESGKIESGAEASLTLQRDGRPVDIKVTLEGRSRGRGQRAFRPSV